MQPSHYSQLTFNQRRQVRLLYVAEQDKKCWYCKSDLEKDPPQNILDKKITLSLFPKGFLDNPVHLHHDHDTDLTIGAVHAYCNAVLWEYEGQ